MFLDLHRGHGVDFRLGARWPRSLVSADAATGVRLADGTEISADAVVVAIGVAPATGLAEAAGLEVDNGVVDAALRTCDPDIFAAGDVASASHPLLGRHVRVEHWANALHGGPAAARSMLGQPVSYDRVPYFFSDQYDLGMEYVRAARAGHLRPGGVPGRPASAEFIAFWLSGGRVVAGMNVNVWDVDDIQALIRGGPPGRHRPAGRPGGAAPGRDGRSPAQRPRRCAVRSRCSRMMFDAASGSRRRTALMNCSCSRVPRVPISGAASSVLLQGHEQGPAEGLDQHDHGRVVCRLRHPDVKFPRQVHGVVAV